MNENDEALDHQLPLDSTGQRLRRAREAAGMTVEQLAAETRIPQRHIETIERGEFAALPSRTYATGFSRTYARAVGLDENDVLTQLRAELGQSGTDRLATPRFEPGDPARVPSRGLTWLSLLAIVLLAVGGYAFYRSYFAPGLGPAPLEEPRPVAPQPNAPATIPAVATGEVVFTALEEGVWVKFYDRNGRQLMQKQMAQNESYVVPADAEGPQIWTGRPDALRITVGGKPVPKLSDDERVMKDVPVTAEALLARPPAGPPAGT